MNMSKLLSIVVPIYNTDEFLERCLTSILKNEYENYEVILVDDGSSDRCPEICDEYMQKSLVPPTVRTVIWRATAIW